MGCLVKNYVYVQILETIGLNLGQNISNAIYVCIIYRESRALNDRFLFVFRGLKGSGSSGKLIGSVSTYPDTYKSSGSRVMAPKSP